MALIAPSLISRLKAGLLFGDAMTPPKPDDLPKENASRLDSFEEIYRTNVNKNRWMIGIVVVLAGLAVDRIIENQDKQTAEMVLMKGVQSLQAKDIAEIRKDIAFQSENKIVIERLSEELHKVQLEIERLKKQ